MTTCIIWKIGEECGNIHVRICSHLIHFSWSRQSRQIMLEEERASNISDPRERERNPIE